MRSSPHVQLVILPLGHWELLGINTIFELLLKSTSVFQLSLQLQIKRATTQYRLNAFFSVLELKI